MENKRKKSFGIINFIKDNRIEIVCGCCCCLCCCLVLFVGIMAIKEVCDPAFQQKMQQEEQRQDSIRKVEALRADSIRKVEALRADSIRKVEAQIQLRKTMISGYVDDDGYIVARVENLSKDRRTRLDGHISSLILYTEGEAGTKETLCYIVDTDQGTFHMYRQGEYTLRKATHYYGALKKGEKYRFKFEEKNCGSFFNPNIQFCVTDIKKLNNAPL
jgi:hypothetical protein